MEFWGGGGRRESAPYRVVWHKEGKTFVRRLSRSEEGSGPRLLGLHCLVGKKGERVVGDTGEKGGRGGEAGVCAQGKKKKAPTGTITLPRKKKRQRGLEVRELRRKKGGDGPISRPSAVAI